MNAPNPYEPTDVESTGGAKSRSRRLVLFLCAGLAVGLFAFGFFRYLSMETPVSVSPTLQVPPAAEE